MLIENYPCPHCGRVCDVIECWELHEAAEEGTD